MSAETHPVAGAAAHGAHDAAGHGHDPHLSHHFDDLDQQSEATTLGMWMFLVTEILFFGGLFLAYTIYRSQHPDAFAAGSHHLSLLLGGINTVVLIVSSLTMALAVRAAVLRDRGNVTLWLIATMVLGAVFLGIKAVEYTEKFQHHLWPGNGFEWHAAGTPAFVRMYFTIYFTMTGLHATHMVVGIAILAIILAQGMKGPLTQRYATRVETMGLYWHFVDIVWIFLFPLLYLLGRH